MADELTSIEAEIRHAVGSDSFAEASRLLEAYLAAAERRFRELPVSSSSVRSLAARTRDLLEWVNAMVLAARASDAAELDRVRMVARYKHAVASLGGTQG